MGQEEEDWKVMYVQAGSLVVANERLAPIEEAAKDRQRAAFAHDNDSVHTAFASNL